VNQPLHLFEDRRPFLRVEFLGLQRIQFVDVRIAAVCIGPALDDKRGEPRRGVAERATRRAQDPLVVFLGGERREKAGALDRL
jgi:hypothetical protein